MSVYTVRTKGVPFNDKLKHTVLPDGTVQFRLNPKTVDWTELANKLRDKVFELDPVDKAMIDAHEARMDRAYDTIMKRRRDERT